MKKIILILLFCSNISLLAFTGNGSGTAEDPYQITNLDELNQIRDDLEAHYILMNDIDASDTRNWNVGDHDNDPATPDSAMGWVPVGEDNNGFYGHLDGKGYTINEVYINRPTTSYFGIFELTNNATIKNIIFENLQITGNQFIGGLVSDSYGSIFKNIKLSGDINGSWPVGGITCRANTSLISNCSIDMNITGTGLVGGIAGAISSTIIQYSYSKGNVIAESYAGGIVGGPFPVYSGRIRNCYSRMNISGNSEVCGIVGGNPRFNSYRDLLNISKSYYAGIISCDSLSSGISNFGEHEKFVCDITAQLSFWDMESSKIDDSGSGTGKSTAEMKDIETYLDADWDFETTWSIDPDINDGYPYLDLREKYQPQDTDHNGYINIRNLKDLNSIRNIENWWKYNYELDNDIDASDTKSWNEGRGWLPLLTYLDDDNNGIFDGKGYSISNLYINRDNETYVGLFGVSIKIHNLSIINCDINGYKYVGSFAGSCSELYKSNSNGKINGKFYVGGISGIIAAAERSFSNCNVTGNSYVGAFVGELWGGKIKNCFSKGKVYGSSSVGGFCGLMSTAYSRVTNCYSVTEVKAEYIFGAFLGEFYSGTEENCFYNYEVCKENSGYAKSHSTKSMKDINTFLNAGWDFGTIWAIDPEINDGYPYLQGMNIPVGIKENYLETRIYSAAYPTPANEHLILEYDIPEAAAVNIIVFDAAGQLVFNLDKGIQSGEQQERIDLMNFPSGQYFFRIGIGEKHSAGKFVVVK